MRRVSLNNNLKKVIREVGQVGQFLWQRSWAEKNAGNISVDVTRLVTEKYDLSRDPLVLTKIPDPILADRHYIVKVMGARPRDIAENYEKNLLLICVARKLNGYYILWGGTGPQPKATSELISHLKIHALLRRSRRPQKAILHTHPTHLVALTHIRKYCSEGRLSRLLWSMHPELKITLPEGVGFTRYQCPGTEKLADATVAALKRHRVAVWEKHGCIAIGEDISNAFDLIDTVNKAATIFIMCRCAGFIPEGLNLNELKELDMEFGLKGK